MSRAVLGIYDDAGPVLIRSSHGASKPTSQDMAVLGSVMIYAQGLGHPFGSILTEDCRISFKRPSPTLMLSVITSSKFASEIVLGRFLEVAYVALQMIIGPSQLEAIASVNTNNDALRRALIGTGSVLDAFIDNHVSSAFRLMAPLVTLIPHKQSVPIADSLHQLCQQAGTEYAAIVYDDIFAVATQSFWQLHPEELVVLQMVLHAVPESSTLAQIPVHLTHTSSEGSWHLMIATLTAGCRLVLLTSKDMTVAQLQAMVPVTLGSLKQQLLKASSCAVSRNLHSLQAFILCQQHPDCVMMSSCPTQSDATHLITDAHIKSDHQPMSHASRHQWAFDTLSVFAASLADQMRLGSPSQADAQQPEIVEAFAEVAGLRLAAVSDQHGRSRRTLFAVLSPELSASPEKELAQQLLSLLKHLPLIGSAH